MRIIEGSLSRRKRCIEIQLLNDIAFGIIVANEVAVATRQIICGKPLVIRASALHVGTTGLISFRAVLKETVAKQRFIATQPDAIRPHATGPNLPCDNGIAIFIFQAYHRRRKIISSEPDAIGALISVRGHKNIVACRIIAVIGPGLNNVVCREPGAVDTTTIVGGCIAWLEVVTQQSHRMLQDVVVSGKPDIVYAIVVVNHRAHADTGSVVSQQ